MQESYEKIDQYIPKSDQICIEPPQGFLVRRRLRVLMDDCTQIVVSNG